MKHGLLKTFLLTVSLSYSITTPYAYSGDIFPDEINTDLIKTGHLCEIEEGDVHCQGLNQFGQLGNGTEINSLNKKVRVKNLAGRAKKVVNGVNYSCALIDGLHNVVQCWGSNQQGELGIEDPTLSKSSLPIQVSALNSLLNSQERIENITLETESSTTCVELGHPISVSEYLSNQNDASFKEELKVSVFCWGKNPSDSIQNSLPSTTLNKKNTEQNYPVLFLSLRTANSAVGYLGCGIQGAGMCSQFAGQLIGYIGNGLTTLGTDIWTQGDLVQKSSQTSNTSYLNHAKSIVGSGLKDIGNLTWAFGKMSAFSGKGLNCIGGATCFVGENLQSGSEKIDTALQQAPVKSFLNRVEGSVRNGLTAAKNIISSLFSW